MLPIMRNATIIALLAVGMPLVGSGKNASGAPGILPSGYHVTACFQPSAHGATMIRAQYLSSRIFAGVGLLLDWTPADRRCASESAVKITFRNSTRPTELPGALAYALPYEGSHIVVFYDRVEKSIEPSDVPSLLAHVIVHEITHLIQGLNRHSESGIMKARWSEADFSRMAREPLTFTDADLWLIRSGLESSQKRFLYRVVP